MAIVMEVLLGIAIAAPFLTGVYLLAAGRHTSQMAAQIVTLGAVAVAALGLLGLILGADGGLGAAIASLPHTGTRLFVASRTGLYASLTTTLACLLPLVVEAWYRSGPRAEAPNLPLSRALLLLVLAASHAAFLSGHFGGRYITLEAIALGLALAPLIDLAGSGTPTVSLSVAVFVLLRIGDAGLLTAMLLLFNASGTLDIELALQAAQSLGRAGLGWAAGGFLLAAWVKLGMWPFHLWLHIGRRLPLASRAWLYAVVLPNLGTYLLYRVTPLLALNDLLRAAAFCMGIGGIVMPIRLLLIHRTPGTRALALQSVLGGLTFILAAMGLQSAVWASLPAFTPLRLLLSWPEARPMTSRRTQECAYRPEMRLIAVLTQGAAWTRRLVEQGGLEGFWLWLVRGVPQASQSIQRLSTGRLRHKLLWIAVSLALAVLILALFEW